MSDGPKKQKEVFKKAPTLYAITTFKLVKGALFAAVALIIYAQSDNDLPSEYQNMLQWLHHVLRVNPEREFWTDLAVSIDNLTEARMVHFAVGTLIYSLFSLVEGVGLLFRVKWAGWMAIGESAFFIPIEIRALMRHRSLVVLLVLIANVIIVAYLYRNRNRLFHHRHFSEHRD